MLDVIGAVIVGAAVLVGIVSLFSDGLTFVLIRMNRLLGQQMKNRRHGEEDLYPKYQVSGCKKTEPDEDGE